MTQSAQTKSREMVPDLGWNALMQISAELRRLPANIFSLYVKTKNFQWHIGGRDFRDYRLLLDERAGQIFAMSDDIAERTRKIGGTTLQSIGDIARNQRLKDNDDCAAPLQMMRELLDNNRQLTGFLRAADELCARRQDVATTSLIETWIDETECQCWFLAEIVDEL
jgi:starvation-inducible DNA-binding protein